MANQNKLFLSFPLFFFITLLTVFQQVIQASSHHHHHRRHHHNLQEDERSVRLSKLFVFGDSYADTGNNRKNSSSWIVPYGTTFPGKPAGRSSDGRILTDYIASYMKIKSPIPYRWRKYGIKALDNGMNFAHGGTGVFDTLNLGPNMTTQIHFFEKLLNDGVYTKSDLDTSIALFSVAGNDYASFIFKNGSLEGLLAFIPSVVNQLAINLRSIHELGVRKVLVTGLQPLGCLPNREARSSCNETQDKAVIFHNSLLQEMIVKLNNQTNDSSFVILHLYSAFMSAFKSQGDRPGSLKFENPLRACCMGVSKEYSCGSMGVNGTKKYTVCNDPKSTFFWDDVHPTEQGWREVYTILQPSLKQLYH